MAYQRKMLFRDSLDDIGDMSRHGSYCASPDMIVHSSVNNPKLEFGTNYSVDPNESVDRSSRANTIYTRVKSMQESAGTITGYIRLYRADASLFMNTDQWRHNGLRTLSGHEYVKVTTTNNGEIVVGEDVFLVDGTKPNFCMVGIVNDSAQETLPGNFSTYSDFVSWVHKERCVAVRNFSLVTSGEPFDYESLYCVANPERRARLSCILVEASGLPRGTIVGLKNKALRIDAYTEFNPDCDSGKHVTGSAFLEAGYKGFVTIYARLPKGQVWPEKASILATLWVGVEEKEDMIQFAYPANQVLPDRSSLENLGVGSGGGKLVKVGYCKTLYI